MLSLRDRKTNALLTIAEEYNSKIYNAFIELLNTILEEAQEQLISSSDTREIFQAQGIANTALDILRNISKKDF